MGVLTCGFIFISPLAEVNTSQSVLNPHCSSISGWQGYGGWQVLIEQLEITKNIIAGKYGKARKQFGSLKALVKISYPKTFRMRFRTNLRLCTQFCEHLTSNDDIRN